VLRVDSRVGKKMTWCSDAKFLSQEAHRCSGQRRIEFWRAISGVLKLSVVRRLFAKVIFNGNMKEEQKQLHLVSPSYLDTHRSWGGGL
jgi:hypothetical protein